jgi:uncharacterized repeat protein (TIGR01451 family)
MLRRRPARLAALAAVALLAPMLATAGAGSVTAAGVDDSHAIQITPKGEIANEASEADEQGSFAKLRDAYYETRLLAGDDPLTIQKAATLRGKSIKASSSLPTLTTNSAQTVDRRWTSVGPNPLLQVARTSSTLQAVSGRIGALAVLKNGRIILGAAQGGVWTLDAGSHTWVPRSQDTDTQAVGALAVAPSNDSVVYMGSGEGALSGDSYYGDGIYRSADGGTTWAHVSSDFFAGNSTSDIVVDPADANHLYIATLRGRGGVRRTTPPSTQPYGIWESTDGGAHWALLKGTTSEFAGATDLVMDPLNSKILWASFWGDGIYRSQNGGKSWSNAMGNLPQGQYAAGATRFSLGIAHLAGQYPVIYVGFDYFDKKGGHHPSTVWRNDSGGLAWTHLPTGGPASNPDSILDYCTTQCFYDNVVMPDPTNPDIVYVEGSYGYDQSPQSGGVYRSTDGGQTWKSLGYDLHPDFHALAFQPNDTKHVVIGNDGGVWQSFNRGGRLADGAPLSAADWEDLNGAVADDGSGTGYGLAITQFTSIATAPTNPGRLWGGTQDNGTLRKPASSALSYWYDQASGDGGQVLVDPTNPGWSFGTYTALTPYRYSPAKATTIFGNELIDGGINTKDRAEFYVPWVMNQSNPNQLFLGSYRLYRTNNAEAPSSGDVSWEPISGDLTSGCTGTAPNGARGCLISAVGLAQGGDGVYTGSDDGYVEVSPNAVNAPADKVTWNRVGQGVLPNRPVTQFAVDRSNWRTAYISYAGFDQATPGTPGHVWKTTDGGQTWANITHELPNVPVNSIVVDAAFPNTLYAGTDIGPYVTSDGGGSWQRMNSTDSANGAMPKVAIWQLDFDPSHRVLAAGTHGRGAYLTTDAATAPALVLSKADSGRPVGPGNTIDYAVSVKNIGNAGATGVTVTDPVPAHTSNPQPADGGTVSGGSVTWSGLTVPAGQTVRVHFSVTIDGGTTTPIVDDGMALTGANVTGVIKGSPHTTAIAPTNAVSASPAQQAGGARVGTAAHYTVHVKNDGYMSDTFAVSAESSGGWNSHVFAADCTTPLVDDTTAAVAAGDTSDVCVTVDVPAAAADDSTHDSTVSVASTTASDSATATLHTIAVASDTVLVDEDGDSPDVSSHYKAALTTNIASFGYWDIAADPNLPATYLAAHKNVVWFTGNSYPAPITPYEAALKTFLDGGGRLFMSGQDILDQAAGSTPFVHDYLHITWDGSDRQNDQATASVHGVAANPVTGTIGTVPLDHSVLGATFEDEITPNGTAQAAFADGSNLTDALTYSGTYKVMFLAFPFEAYGSTADKTDLMGKALTFFGP